MITKTSGRKGSTSNTTNEGIVNRERGTSNGGWTNNKTETKNTQSNNISNSHSTHQGNNTYDNGDKRLSSRKDKRTGSFSAKKLEKLFESYTEAEEEGEGGMEVDGIMSFLEDIEIDPEDSVTLVICYHLNASELGYFSKEEFMTGFQKLNVDTIEKIKSIIPFLRNQLSDPSMLREIFRYSFDFYKESEQKKGIEKEVAVTLLKILVSGKPHVDQFAAFLQSQDSYKVINLDQWLLFLEFSAQVQVDFSDYDPSGAWPCIIDEYVEWAKKQESHQD